MLSPQEIESYRSKYKINPVDVPTPAKQGSISEAFGAGVGKMKGAIQDSVGGKNPLSTGSKFAAGLIETVSSPLAPITKPVGKFVGDKVVNPLANKLADAYGEDVQRGLAEGGRTVAEDVLETTGDLATIAGAATMQKIPVAKVAGQVASGARPVAKAAGRTLKSGGEKAYGLTIAPEASTAKAMLNYHAKQPNFVGRLKNMVKGTEVGEKPITEAATAARHGLVGTEYQLGVQGKQTASKIWETSVKPKLAQGKDVNMKSFIGEVEKEIKKSGGDITRRRSLQEALNNIKDDYKNVGSVSLEKLQDYKTGWAELLPDAVYKGKPISAALKEVRNQLAQKAREKIYEQVGPEGKQAYIDYGNLQSIIKAAEKSVQGDPAARSLSRGVWEAVMNKTITPVVTLGGKVLYRTGEGLEFIGNKGARTVKEAVD